MNTIIGELQNWWQTGSPEPYYNKKLCSDEIVVLDRGLIIKDNAVIPGNCMVEHRPDLTEGNVVEDVVRYGNRQLRLTTKL